MASSSTSSGSPPGSPTPVALGPTTGPRMPRIPRGPPPMPSNPVVLPQVMPEGQQALHHVPQGNDAVFFAPVQHQDSSSSSASDPANWSPRRQYANQMHIYQENLNEFERAGLDYQINQRFMEIHRRDDNVQFGGPAEMADGQVVEQGGQAETAAPGEGLEGLEIPQRRQQPPVASRGPPSSVAGPSRGPPSPVAGPSRGPPSPVAGPSRGPPSPVAGPSRGPSRGPPSPVAGPSGQQFSSTLAPPPVGRPPLRQPVPAPRRRQRQQQTPTLYPTMPEDEEAAMVARVNANRKKQKAEGRAERERQRRELFKEWKEDIKAADRNQDQMQIDYKALEKQRQSEHDVLTKQEEADSQLQHNAVKKRGKDAKKTYEIESKSNKKSAKKDKKNSKKEKKSGRKTVRRVKKSMQKMKIRKIRNRRK